MKERMDLFTEEFFGQLISNRDEILKDFAKAYLADSKLEPSKIKMQVYIRQVKNGIRQTIWFEPKNSQ